jgi:tetratricopeptide (TPR) repeat protein
MIVFFICLCLNAYGEEPGNNPYLDKNSEEYKILLSILDEKYYKSANAFWRELDFVNEYYPLAKNYYDQKEYEKAIDNFVIICQKYSYAIVYYYLGMSLSDIGDYESSKSAFQKSIQASSRSLGILDDAITKDHNGAIRERYFPYYNIACIESLLNNIDSAYEYLCKAFFYGYPYINHIKNDPDLNNLLSYNNGSFLKSIENVYNAGSNNTVAKKAFGLNWGGAPLEYHFISDDFIRILVGSVWPDPSGWISASYEIKNYLIIIKNKEYHYNEEERFRSEQSILYIKDFEDLTEKSEYKEIPLEKYIGRYNGRDLVSEKSNNDQSNTKMAIEVPIEIETDINGEINTTIPGNKSNNLIFYMIICLVVFIIIIGFVVIILRRKNKKI